ncbi:MAG: DUF4342 domain-containing protein [Limnochordia bacterium]|jgi:hypothetical protein|nr:DUF4342 domain-containing protein [Bacillota bacterium]HOB09639.1 DUF4342 domain-containing protein [Limnochordia bacterium]NLH31794.1 DUF4342 domain-containing protein [Bacillota bacterium]HPT93554.1 DUF4342 domain-containing protein [Limnochordia bacterium]HPZ31555.1 DUF4342 domain-containing protein [Limnochordia bacterium]
MSAGLINEELQKIDVVRERTGLSFTDARSLLESVNWDVMEALITADRSAQKRIWEVRGMEVVDRVRQLVRKGNATNIRIKTNDRVIIELPVTAGVLGTVLAPKLALLAGAACLLTKCSVEFDQVSSQN